MDVLAMLRSDLLQAAGIYAFLVLFAAVSLLIMKSQAAKQAGRAKGRRVAGWFSSAVQRFAARRSAAGPLLRRVRVAGGRLTRSVGVVGGPLVRRVRVVGGPLVRGVRIAGGWVTRGVRIAGGPMVRTVGGRLRRGGRNAGGLPARMMRARWARPVRTVAARIAPVFAPLFASRWGATNPAAPEGETIGGEAHADHWAAMPDTVRAATAGAGPLARRARELVRYAGEVGVAAERAANMAKRARQEWLAAQEQLEEAWHAFETSETDARRFDRAAVLPLPHAPKTPAEYAFRERYLHRVAMAACSRRQLSALELSDALAHREGWDPKRHPAEQEVVLRRAVRDCMWAGYRAAATREKAAWHTAEMAQEAKLSLRREAAEASALARQAASGKPLALATWTSDDAPAPSTVDIPSWTATPASVESRTLILPIANAVTSPLPTRVRSAALDAGRQAARRGPSTRLSPDSTVALGAPVSPDSTVASGAPVSPDGTVGLGGRSAPGSSTGSGVQASLESVAGALMTPRILESVKLAAQAKEQAEAQKGAAGRLLAKTGKVTLAGYRDSVRQGSKSLVENGNTAWEGWTEDSLAREGWTEDGLAREGWAEDGLALGERAVEGGVLEGRVLEGGAKDSLAQDGEVVEGRVVEGRPQSSLAGEDRAADGRVVEGRPQGSPAQEEQAVEGRAMESQAVEGRAEEVRLGRSQQGGSPQGRSQPGRRGGAQGARGGAQGARGGGLAGKGRAQGVKGGQGSGQATNGGAQGAGGGGLAANGGAQGAGGGGLAGKGVSQGARGGGLAGKGGGGQTGKGGAVRASGDEREAAAARKARAAEAMTTATVVLPVIVAEKPYVATRSRRRG